MFRGRDNSGLSRGYEVTVALAYQDDKPKTVVYGVNKYAETSLTAATLTKFKLSDAAFEQFRNQISDPARKSVTIGGKRLNLWYYSSPRVRSRCSITSNLASTCFITCPSQ